MYIEYTCNTKIHQFILLNLFKIVANTLLEFVIIKKNCTVFNLAYAFNLNDFIANKQTLLTVYSVLITIA